MWQRKELKARGLAAFKANYWKCILVSLILVFIVGGGTGFGNSFGNGFSNGFKKDIGKDSIKTVVTENNEDATADNGNDVSNGVAVDDGATAQAKLEKSIKGSLETGSFWIILPILILIVLIVVLVIAAIALVMDAFLFNPIKLGCYKFFVQNLDEPTTLNHLTTGFETNYKNIVKVLFFRELYLFLWMLIPIAGIFIAIVKGYEYMMIPYLVADDPDMSKEDAFALSKQMMYGQKWRAFVLNLSFIGWHLLSLLTIGILAIFYVTPYVESVHAALYDTLKYNRVETE